MLFGDQSPKIIIDPDGINFEIKIEYVIIKKDEAENDFLIHESVFTGYRNFITEVTIDEIVIKRKYWIVELFQHLYKYGPAAAVYYNTIKKYEGANVRFYRHSNGIYLKDGAGEEVPMFIEKIEENYFDTPDKKDYLFYRFKSTKYVDMTQGVI